MKWVKIVIELFLSYFCIITHAYRFSNSETDMLNINQTFFLLKWILWISWKLLFLKSSNCKDFHIRNSFKNNLKYFQADYKIQFMFVFESNNKQQYHSKTLLLISVDPCTLEYYHEIFSFILIGKYFSYFFSFITAKETKNFI
jgi:hypothetical protein